MARNGNSNSSNHSGSCNSGEVRRTHHAVMSAVRSSITERRHWLTPVLALALMMFTAVGAVIVSSVTQRDVAFNDGTVWVTSMDDRRMARFNVRISQADVAVASSAARFDVMQQGDITVLDEMTRLTGIDAAAVTLDHTVRTGDRLSVRLGGETIACLDTATGEVWVGDARDLEALSLDGEPQLELGSFGGIVVDRNGVVYGIRHHDGMVFAVSGPYSRHAQELGVIDGIDWEGTDEDRPGENASDGGIIDAGTIDSFTVIDGMPVVGMGGRVCWLNGCTSVDSAGPLTLQHPPADSNQSGWVAVAGVGGLFLIDLERDGSEPVTLANGGTGAPTEPVSVDGCVHAAWSQNAHNYIRLCSPQGEDGTFSSLKHVAATDELRFRTNHRLVILNDVTDGVVWNPAESAEAIAIQWDALQDDRDAAGQSAERTSDATQDYSATCAPDSGHITAVDDEFGARPGTRVLLDVLRNDRQIDCSVLRITAVESLSDDSVQVNPAYDGRYLQFDATKASSGTITFVYRIDDARGQSSTAHVTVTVADGENHAPRQIDPPPHIDVEQGATYTTNALASFADPDGDPMTVVSAIVEHTDQATATVRADGRLDVDTGALTEGRVGVQITVSDGVETGTGMMYFSIRPSDTLSATIDPAVRRAVPGDATVIDLSPYVHGTSASPVRLIEASAPTGASVTIDPSTLSLTFEAATPGSYLVPYTIRQGNIDATGLVRVEADAADDSGSRPIAVNDVALLDANGMAVVEPLLNDTDPLGGVLAVTAVETDHAPDVKAGIDGNARVYLTARRLPTSPVELTYTIANAAGTARGTIVVHPPATQADTLQAPDIDVSVRTGGIVSVNVLDHVGYGGSGTVSLDSSLRSDGTLDGLLFASGDSVRYQAGDAVGSCDVIYTVRSDQGGTASGTIRIAVHRRDADDKPDSEPRNVDAQVAAGEQVHIPITLSGIDADGDDVTLLGLGNTAPTLGRIIETGADYLVYEAYPDSTGSDLFDYAVEDWTGRRTQARIRVSIFDDGATLGVLARDDAITLRPDTTATVAVTDNDIGHGKLVVTDELEAQGLDQASTNGDGVTFTTPGQAGTGYVVYTVEDETGLSDTATLTVTVDPNALIMPPVVHDYRVPPEATIDKRTVEVDVSTWMDNPSGTRDELRVEVDASAAEHAWIAGDGRDTVLVIALTDEARAVPYTVTNTTYGVASTAFIHVPAYGVFPPTVRPHAPRIEVDAGASVTIAVADHVRVGAGKTVAVSDADSVSATKAADDDLYVDDHTLRFTAPDDYAGPASITFTAVDGTEDDDVRIINSAVITLPITVIGRAATAPTFSAPTIDVAAGETSRIDLTTLTSTPGESDNISSESLAYSYGGGLTSDAVHASVSTAGILTVMASPDANVGAIANVPITITYTEGDVSAGVTVRVTGSSRPLARLGSHRVTLHAGDTQTVDITADAYNPFPEQPLNVVSCTVDDTSAIAAECRDDALIVTAAADTGGTTADVSITVRDATDSRDREVAGHITVTVVDRPAAPLVSPVSGKPADSAVTLSWTPGDAHGSPITEFEVRWSDGAQSCGTATTCRIGNLTNGTSYTFTVRAKNGVGWSDDSNTVTAMPDRPPSAPRNVQVHGGYHSAIVRWDPPEYAGSLPDGYSVVLTGSNGWVAEQRTGEARSATFDVPDASIADGVTFSAQVTARNRAGEGATASSHTSATVWGDPQPPAVTLTQHGDTIRIDISLGQGRNAGCSRISLSGSVDDTMACAPSAHITHPITRAEYWQPFRITATVVPERDGASTATADASIIPVYDIKPPRQVTVRGSGSTCTVNWTGDGEFDGFRVQLDGFAARTLGETATSATFQLQPWQRCGTASVSQTLLGNTGPQASASGDYVNGVPADLDDMWVEWVDAKTVRIRGYDFETWGQPAMFTLRIDHTDYAVAAGQTSVQVDADIPPGTGTRHTWRFTVTGTADDRLTNTASGIIANARPALGKAIPPAFSLDASTGSPLDHARPTDCDNPPARQTMQQPIRQHAAICPSHVQSRHVPYVRRADQ